MNISLLNSISWAKKYSLTVESISLPFPLSSPLPLLPLFLRYCASSPPASPRLSPSRPGSEIISFPDARSPYFLPTIKWPFLPLQRPLLSIIYQSLLNRLVYPQLGHRPSHLSDTRIHDPSYTCHSLSPLFSPLNPSTTNPSPTFHLTTISSIPQSTSTSST